MNKSLLTSDFMSRKLPADSEVAARWGGTEGRKKKTYKKTLPWHQVEDKKAGNYVLENQKEIKRQLRYLGNSHCMSI